MEMALGKVIWDSLDWGLTRASLTGGEGFEQAAGIARVKADIVQRLQGVPLDTVTIAPSVLEQMSRDPAAYNRYMANIDEYVWNYKKYNCPGIVTMSFSIDSEGRNCIRGVNELLRQMCLGNWDGEEEEKDRDGAFMPQTAVPMLDLDAMLARLACMGAPALGFSPVSQT